MRCLWEKILFLTVAFCVLISNPGLANQSPVLEVTAPSALLMEASTGKVLYEKECRLERPIASVTKIMTALLIMEAIDHGSLKYDDMVTASEYASKMGGSQIYLEAGEKMSVENMLKAILVSSANDACAAMAEHLAGSVEMFVANMNKRAKELGMENTNFVNTNGLDVENHYSCAYDVALMSKELLKHPDVKKYTTIWQDSLRDGSFVLSNTNKLIRFYDGATGLKTGYTTKAKYCLSASAKKNEMELIAVVLAAPTSNDRFSDAKKLLDFGFANYEIKQGIEKEAEVGEIKVENGKSDMLKLVTGSGFSALDEKTNKSEIKKNIEIPDSVTAPVEKGQVIGQMKFLKGEEELGCVDLVAANEVPKKTYFDILNRMVETWFCMV